MAAQAAIHDSSRIFDGVDRQFALSFTDCVRMRVVDGRLRGHDEVDGASRGICVPKGVIVEERITREGRP